MINFCLNCQKNRRSPLFPNPSIKGTNYFPRDFVCKACEKKILKDMSKPVKPIYTLKEAEKLGYQESIEDYA